jgi:hypothetical protein
LAETSVEADLGVTLGMSPLLLVLDVMPLTILHVTPAPVRSSASSGFLDSTAPTPSSSAGVGAELAKPILPCPSLSKAAELSEKFIARMGWVMDGGHREKLLAILDEMIARQKSLCVLRCPDFGFWVFSLWD